MSFIEVEDIQSLQIGTWVKLEGSWFSHPFPTNTFTIKSSEDLATIKGLTNVTILYDPERSQPVSSDDISNGSDDEVGVPTELVDAEVTETFSNGGEEARHEEEALIPESALSELLDRREDYHEFYDHLRKVEGAYQKTLSQGQELFQQLSGRRPAGLKTGDTLITNIMQALNNPKTAMSLIDLVGSNGVAWGLSEHAINVCTLSLLIGRQFSLEDEVLLELGRGACFMTWGTGLVP
jgi:hypothetical protein